LPFVYFLVRMDNKRLILPTLPRYEEEAILRQALKAVKEHHDVRVVLLGGPSGTGKSTLAATVLKPTSSSCSSEYWFAGTKFDARTNATNSIGYNDAAPLMNLRTLVAELLRATLSQQCSLSSKALYQQLDSRQYQILQTFSSMTIAAHDKGVLRSISQLSSSTTSDNEHLQEEESKEESKELQSAEEEKEDVEALSREFDEAFSTIGNQDGGAATADGANVNKDSLSVLTTALKMCLRAISSVSTVILTLDDLQWACPLTLQVLTTILTDPSLHNVLLCGTYRTLEEDSATSPGFHQWKDNLQQQLLPADEATTISDTAIDAATDTTTTDPTSTHSTSSKFQIIHVGNFTQLQVQQLLADAMHREIDEVHDLALTIYGFTDGNGFFLKHFLEQLQDDALLFFDYLSSFQWKYDLDKIRRHSSLSENVVHTVAKRIYKLPPQVQQVLLLAACFGSTFDARAVEASKSILPEIGLSLSTTTAGSDDNNNGTTVTINVHDALKVAEEQGFIIPLSNTRYKFAHEMIQLTAYGLLPEDVECGQMHWKMGCRLLENKELLNEDAILFATVDLLNNAATGVDGNEGCLEKECGMRRRLAELNYQAGCRAAALSAFFPASRYLEAAIVSLGKDKPFETDYQLAYKVYKLAATTEYVGGDIDASMNAAQQIMTHAASCAEKIPVMPVLLDCMVAKNKPAELLDYCLTTLETMGEKFPRKPNAVHVQVEYQKMKHRIKSLTDEDILALPPMTNATEELKVQFIHRLVLPLYQMEQQLLSTLTTCRMINITLDHGYSNRLTPIALVMAASNLIAQSHDVREGYRLGKLAATLVERNGGMNGNNAQDMVLRAQLTKWWLEPATNGLDIFINAHKVAMKAGQIGSAFSITVGYGINYFYSGLPLEPLLQDIERYCNQYLEYNQPLFFLMGSPLWQFLLNLTGRSDNPANVMEGIIIEKRKAMPNPNNSGAQTLQSFQMIMSYYLGDLPKASEVSD